MTIDLEQTVDLSREPPDSDAFAQVDSGTETFAFLPATSRIGIERPDSATGLNQRFNEATRLLLRQRLIIAALTLASILILIKVPIYLTGRLTTTDLLERSFALVLLSGIFVYLIRAPKASLRVLRLLEILLIAVPIIEATTVQVLETERLVSTGRVESVPMLHATIGATVSLFIAIYGMFIPSNWRRTAIITGFAALLPTIVTFVQLRLTSSQLIETPSLITPFLLIMTAVVATVASHVVHAIRREAETARHYGQYELTREIGRGGMGVVFKAQHRLLKRPAAIKLIRSESAFDEQAIERFEQEVQLSATLSHWNTVQIYDYGRTKEGDFYYVMEFLEGQSLQKRLRQTKGMSVSKTVAIVAQLCDGLEEAHTKSLVHRDLKPGNIFLARTGGRKDVVKILDFGLAIIATGDDKHANSISGSPPYMSPEQIRGEAVDGRSDIYAIGCVMFECLTGRSLFHGKSISQIFDLHLTVQPDLDDLPESANELKPVIEGCLQKDLDQRFSNVGILRETIAAVSLTETSSIEVSLAHSEQKLPGTGSI